ncbi:hypothetical protein HX891_01895 [Pseudomonas reactans]|uniref:hypothetical protein n=1 Tax=Pseudomonas reactans TaxID=117680 RepID=UPI0015BF93ED|nr:hypothetical protein [Pseudomonas reactans]NWD79115.1 hypothetical protein [Pseudomonas reactans]
MSEKIDRLINSTRNNYPHRVNVGYYEVPLEKIKNVADRLSIDVKVKIVYSSTRSAESISLGESEWLVYDQYMGQSINLLNRIFIEADDHRPALTYFHKALAERLLEVGKLSEALHCALYYSQERKILEPKRVNENLRGLMTTLQEQFYFYHEFGHIIYRKPGTLPLVRQQVQDIVEHLITEKNLSLEDTIARLRAAPPAAYHHADLEEAIAEQRREFGKKSRCQFVNATLSALADPGIQEEIFCDIFSADLLSLEAFVQGSDPVDVLRSIYIGFYHLQAFEYIKRFPDLPRGAGKLEHDWSFDNVPKVQVRSHCLRTHLLFIYESHLRVTLGLDETSTSARLKQFNIQLMEDQKRHYEVIYDVSMRLCDGLRRGNRIAKLGKKVKNLLKKDAPSTPYRRDLMSAEKTQQMVLSATGWLHDAPP